MVYDIKDILPLITAIELRDAYTQGHSQRVAFYARDFAQSLQLSKKEIEDIYIAGLLHYLGKIAIPDTILLKPSKLEKHEYDLIKLHSTISAEIIKQIPDYSYLADIAKYHHENYDGSGYPEGLKGEEIPIASRILSICDVFDALTTRRVYRISLSIEQSLEIMKDLQRNKKFDPYLFEKFIDFIQKYGTIKQNHIKKIQYLELEKLRNNFFFIDHLTQLLNRVGILAILKKTRDLGIKVNFLEINIKNFKEYNRLYGISKGDDLLKTFALFLKQKFSPALYPKEPKPNEYFLARVHADKFVLLCTCQKSEYLQYKLENLLKSYEKISNIKTNYRFYIKNEQLPLNIERELGYLL